MKRFLSPCMLLSAALVLTIPARACAAAPPYVPVQGLLADANGTPLDGSFDITFGIYNVQMGGTPLWSELKNVLVEDGFFTVYLGMETPLDLGLFRDNETLFLGVRIETDNELPRIVLATGAYSGYAQYSGDSASVGGIASSEVVTQSYLSGNDVEEVTNLFSQVYTRTEADQRAPRIATSTSGSTTYLTTSCLNYTNASVTMIAPRAGMIVVTASVWILLNHVLNTTDDLVLGIGSTTADCGDSYNQVRYSIPAEWPTASDIDRTFTVRRTFSVSAGTYTYYLNGYMASGSDSSDRFWFASMDAMFIPSL